jgi:hypothetical protein
MSTSCHKEKSLLLGLPAEIQTIIYSYACQHTSPLHIATPKSQPYSMWDFGPKTIRLDFIREEIFMTRFPRSVARRNRQRLDASTGVELALTCKAIRKIVKGDLLFYKANTFSFPTGGNAVSVFIRDLEPRKTAAIRSIRFLMSSVYLAWGLRRLNQCTGLQHLVLDVIDLPGISRTGTHDFNFERYFLTEYPQAYEELTSLRGLQTFKILFSPHLASPYLSIIKLRETFPQDREELDQRVISEIIKFRDKISALVTQPRRTATGREFTESLYSPLWTIPFVECLVFRMKRD